MYIEIKYYKCKGNEHPHEAQAPMDVTNWINKKPSEIYALRNE